MTNITITPNGDLQFIYSDDLQPLLELGQPTVRRVSHVEPNQYGQWTADMSPVAGPLLGPYVYRGDALDAEREWLEEHGF